MRAELQGDPWAALSPTTLAMVAALWVLSLLVAYFAGKSDEQRKDDEP